MIYEYPYYIEEIRESQCRPDVLWGRTEIMESRKSKSRQIILKARGEEERQCEPDGTMGKQRKERVEKQSRANKQPEGQGGGRKIM